MVPKSVRFALFVALSLCCVQARAQAHSVSLSWTISIDSAASYNIYRLSGACPASGASGFTKITATPITGTAYTDNTVAAGTYCHYATSVLNGAESVPSNLASAVILPGAPTALSIARTN
jgi:hypothetical protein